MQKLTVVRMGAVGVVCALAGGAAGIAASSASSSRPTPVKPPGVVAEGIGPLLGLGPLADAAGPPVHSDAVVPNEKGGFDTITMDRGRFSSSSGDQLTITEGSKTATYKTVTFTIPSDATVRRNGEAAKLSDLKAGDTVLVLQGPKGTVVAAHDAQHPDLLRFKVRAPQHGDLPPLPPKLPPIPDEGSSSRSGEGASGATEPGASS